MRPHKNCYIISSKVGQQGEPPISDTLRVFIALELPKSVQAALQTQIDVLSKTIPPRAVHWVKPDGTHLTLKFLGDVPQKQLPSLEAALREAVKGCPAFNLTAKGLGCFPRIKRPKVVWIGIHAEQDYLYQLRDRIEGQVAPLGYPTEDRPFSPHLTLGRVKTTNGRIIEQIGSVVQGTPVGKLAVWRCDTVNLMQSTLTPSGAIYTPLAQFQLEENKDS
jgi:2'-5' RNA ligase